MQTQTHSHPGHRGQPGQRHWNRGRALADRKQWNEAARAFAHATKAAPGDALYWVNLAHVQCHAGDFEASAASAQRCLQIDPENLLAQRVLARGLVEQRRYAEADVLLTALEAAGCQETDTMLQHASTLTVLRRPGDAAAVLLRLLAINPALTSAYGALSDCCRDQGLRREAAECLRTVLALEPDSVNALARLSMEKRQILDWSDHDEDVRRMSEVLLSPTAPKAALVAAFATLSLPMSPLAQLAASRIESAYMVHGARPLPAVMPAERAGLPIRVGWLSHDFREHPVSQLLVEVLEAMKGQGLELYLYSLGPEEQTPLRARMRAAADRFVGLESCSDAEAARRIRADGVDLLVDLMGHTRGHRMAILGHRPAPVQAAYLGYPASTGATCIDYLIGDPIVTPLQLAHQYSEKIAQMPTIFQPNGRWRPLPAAMTRAQAALPDEAFVMCAFNNTYKILPEAFDVWCAVMREVQHAVLWLKATNGQLQGNARAAAEARGVAGERIVFAPRVSYADHFSRQALADVFVDTWPYNAHTTAADALWAGVPVVTLYGNSFASRVAGSVLSAAGIGELAFSNTDDYRQAVVALAREPGLLAGYRRHLVDNRQQLRLFDPDVHARELTSLLRRMVLRWRQGLPCDHLGAEPAETDPNPQVRACAETGEHA